MSRRKATQLSNDTLARARQQVAQDTANTPRPPTEAQEAIPAMPSVTPIENRSVRDPREKRPAVAKRMTNAQFEKAKERGELDFETIKDMLIHPTIFPTTESLKQEYAVVVRDLRSMGILAFSLIAVIVVLSQFIGR